MKSFALAAMIAVIAGGAQAATTTIDFDSHADGTNLNGADLGGVMITNPSGSVIVYSDNRFGAGYDTPNNAISSFSTGTPYNTTR